MSDLDHIDGLRSTIDVLEITLAARDGEIERLRTAIHAYLDYCAPEDKWQGDPVLLRIRRQMRAALGDEQSVPAEHWDDKRSSLEIIRGDTGANMWKPTIKEIEDLIYIHLISCEPRTVRQGAHDAAKAIWANINPMHGVGQSEDKR